MGTFCTTTSLDTLMPGISFDTATTALGTKCIEWSENWIKSKLSRRYDVSALPFTVATTTSMLTSMGEQLAMGYLYKQISRGSKESITRGNELIGDVQDTVMKIADYECELLNATNGSTVVSDRAGRVEIISSASSYHTTFDEDSPLNWKPDEDKITAIASDRS